MPYKYPKSKDWHVPKQKYRIVNWSEYNKALKNRGSIDFWLTDDAIEQWYEVDQDNIGCGGVVSLLQTLWLKGILGVSVANGHT